MERLLAALVAFFMLAACHSQVVASSYTHYRLPTSIQPDLYHLKIITYLSNQANLTYEGQVSIRFQVLEDTQNITLHVRNLTVDDSRIQLENYSDEDFHLCLEGVDTVEDHDYYIIHLCQTLRQGQTYELKLHFSAILNDEFTGYYHSSYVDAASNETRWLSVTDFEPSSARAAFPCLDEPNYKARFVVWLGHHKSLTALSNMPLNKQMPLEGLGDFVWSIFEESVPMSTYLVAYTINDFFHKESKIEGSDVLFRTWSRRDYIDQCEYAAEVGPQLLEYYEDMFGIPFPLKKIDAIGIPNTNDGAMENWGLITYHEKKLLLAPNSTSKAVITDVIAHELAHQWFGNLVTMEWWNDLWLNEGFATYVSRLGVQKLGLEDEMYTIESNRRTITIFQLDALLDSRPISRPIFNTKTIHDDFGLLTYLKGMAVLGMTHMLIGQDGFFEGVRNYLTTHAYKNAEQDDLWAAFTQSAHKFNSIPVQYDMKTILDSWTLQSGYPLVKVSRSNETGSIEITQHRFLTTPTIPEEEVKKCWWVPLSYTTASEMDFTTAPAKAWLKCDESGTSEPLKMDNVADVNELIIFNIQLSGVYRVMYDGESWRLIADYLKSDKFMNIHIMNRVQIISDVMALSWSGYQGYDITFDLLEYLTRERELLPWEFALNGITDVSNMLKPYPQHQSCLNAYLRYIIEPTYNFVGGLNGPLVINDTASQALLKALVKTWACQVDLEDCVNAAIEYFQKWKSAKNPNKDNKVPFEIRDIVYCSAIRHGNKDDWTFLWQRYKNSNESGEKTSIIKSLGCSRDETVLREYIGLIFAQEEQIPTQDAISAFSAIAGSEVGASLARDYYIEHLSRLDEDFDVADLLSRLSAMMTTTEDRYKVNQLIDSNKEMFNDSAKTIQRVLSTIDAKIEWIERNIETVNTHLQSRLSSMGIPEDNDLF